MWQACWVRSSPAPIMLGHHAVMTAAAACQTNAGLIVGGRPYPFEVALKQQHIGGAASGMVHDSSYFSVFG